MSPGHWMVQYVLNAFTNGTGAYLEVLRCLQQYARAVKGAEESKPVRSRGVWRKKKGDLPKKVVYVFYHKKKVLYVGRSNNLPARMTGHGAASGTQYGATFAFKLLKEKVGKKNCRARRFSNENALLNHSTSGG